MRNRCFIEVDLRNWTAIWKSPSKEVYYIKTDACDNSLQKRREQERPKKPQLRVDRNTHRWNSNGNKSKLLVGEFHLHTFEFPGELSCV